MKSSRQSRDRFPDSPHVCTLHDVGPNYLVMELVEGHTLAERIMLGAIPLEESLNIAKQIAAALEAAHEKESRIAT
jgi:eukaryotic-like serine/threonine-protein kinase